MARTDIKRILAENLENIEKWTAQGLTIKQMAKNLGISERTLYRHKSDSDSQLGQCIKRGRAGAVEELENTMFTSAKGYERKIKKYAKLKRRVKQANGQLEEWEEMVEYEETIYYPPDTTAGIFLLKNWGEYTNEPRAMEFKKKELELKEKQVEATNW